MKATFVLFVLFVFTLADSKAYSPNPVISVAAKGMILLRPIFKAEAALQASVLGSKVDKKDILAEINADKKNNKALVYTYGLSPFSSEAIKILESTGYEFKVKQLGAEWFLLGGKESAIRVALAAEIESGATSLPKVFIGGKCIGGCSELAQLAKSGDLESLLAKAKVPKKKN
ncbi:hypothetical protein ACA910_004061 [Epithemia clementina (nom. ined.)]